MHSLSNPPLCRKSLLGALAPFGLYVQHAIWIRISHECVFIRGSAFQLLRQRPWKKEQTESRNAEELTCKVYFYPFCVQHADTEIITRRKKCITQWRLARWSQNAGEIIDFLFGLFKSSYVFLVFKSVSPNWVIQLPISLFNQDIRSFKRRMFCNNFIWFLMFLDWWYVINGSLIAFDEDWHTPR